MIDQDERAKMRRVRLCGDRVIGRLESIGVANLADLAGRDPWELMHEINLEAGRPIWRAPLAIVALQNLIDVAEEVGERELWQPLSRRPKPLSAVRISAFSLRKRPSAGTNFLPRASPPPATPTSVPPTVPSCCRCSSRTACVWAELRPPRATEQTNDHLDDRASRARRPRRAASGSQRRSRVT